MPIILFAEQFEIYKSNVSTGMLHALSQQLGVTTKSLELIGVGYYPKESCWIFPERNALGEIIGLACRAVNSSKKWFIEGSKRGLTYVINPGAFTGNDKYEPGRHNWIQIYKHKDLTCPICGKGDWCMVSSDNPYDPQAVMCPRTPTGAIKFFEGSGYLHIRKKGGNTTRESVLMPSQLPVLIVEGFTDTATALDLGFVAIGKPSAESGDSYLKSMPLAGRPTWIFGDNDEGVGKRGMDKTFLTLSETIKELKRSLYPTGIKDLRDWYTRLKVTQAEVIEYFNTAGNSGGLDDVFVDDASITVAERFLQELKVFDGAFTLRNYRGQWVEWNGSCYDDIDAAELRGQIYRYVSDKHYKKDTKQGIDILPYRATRSKINDIIDAANAFCVVTGTPPCWLDGRASDFKRMIVFNNGILDVNKYIKGEISLERPTPKLFSYNAIPYDFKEDSECPEWDDALRDIFDGDEDSIRLLAQWAGYLLLPDMSYEKFMMFIGPTRAGKGTIIETLSAMLGDKNCASTTLKSMAGDFGYQKFMGRLAVFLPDVKAPHISETPYLIERMLQITGGDPVNINRKFLTELASIHLTCRFTLAVNEIPELPDYTSALVARLLALQFNKSYLGREDTGLKHRLKLAAAQGRIINFALRGLKDLIATGKFHVPTASKEVERGFREINNPIWAFVYECCDQIENNTVTPQMLFDAWVLWCRQTGIHAGNRTVFTRRLRSSSVGVELVKISVGFGGQGDNSGRMYAYKGLSLKRWVKDAMGEP
jgi:putative DNA primase/helicase